MRSAASFRSPLTVWLTGFLASWYARAVERRANGAGAGRPRSVRKLSVRTASFETYGDQSQKLALPCENPSVSLLGIVPRKRLKRYAKIAITYAIVHLSARDVR